MQAQALRDSAFLLTLSPAGASKVWEGLSLVNMRGVLLPPHNWGLVTETQVGGQATRKSVEVSALCQDKERKRGCPPHSAPACGSPSTGQARTLRVKTHGV